MKRTAAIILSLILIWLQAASAHTISSPPPAQQCGCGTPKKACCCVEQSTPDAAPLPAAPVAASASIDFVAIIPKLLAWTLPATAPAIVSSTAPSASCLAVPLFQRDCALLI